MQLVVRSTALGLGLIFDCIIVCPCFFSRSSYWLVDFSCLFWDEFVFLHHDWSILLAQLFSWWFFLCVCLYLIAKFIRFFFVARQLFVCYLLGVCVRMCQVCLFSA